MSYFAISGVVLQQMYGKASYRKMQKGYPDEIRKQVRDLAQELARPQRRDRTRSR